AEALPQASHVHVDGPRMHVGRDAPYPLEQLGPSKHASRMLEQQRHQAKLHRPERELLTVEPYAMRDRVELEASPGEPAPGRRRLPGEDPFATATRQGLNAQHDFAHAERLDDVVV